MHTDYRVTLTLQMIERFHKGVNVSYKAIVLICSVLILKLVNEDHLKLFHGNTNEV